MRYEFDTTCRLYNIGRTKRHGEDESDVEEQDGEEQPPHSSLGDENDEDDDDDDEDDNGEREDLMDFFSNYLGKSCENICRFLLSLVRKLYGDLDLKIYYFICEKPTCVNPCQY